MKFVKVMCVILVILLVIMIPVNVVVRMFEHTIRNRLEQSVLRLNCSRQRNDCFSMQNIHYFRGFGNT